MLFLLRSDGVFSRSSSSLQYYLTRQGRRVVLREGDGNRPPLERRLNWIPDLAPHPPPETTTKKIILLQQSHENSPGRSGPEGREESIISS